MEVYEIWDRSSKTVVASMADDITTLQDNYVVIGSID